MATHINNCDDIKAEEGCVQKLHSYMKLKHLRILHTEIYHVAFPLEKSPSFYCSVHSIHLLSSALVYLSSDV